MPDYLSVNARVSETLASRQCTSSSVLDRIFACTHLSLDETTVPLWRPINPKFNPTQSWFKDRLGAELLR
eukprot:COSAG05_NODE_409_length_10118_cov_457.524204_9_plen_70_part_00